MFYSDELVEDIREKNDIVDVISGYVKLQKKGSSYFGLCPFHNEKTPSFSVSRQKQMYYCFGCGAGGNVFSFIMNYENFSFAEALRSLAERVGVELPAREETEQEKRKSDLKSELLSIHKEAALFFYHCLMASGGKTAREYLEKRGIRHDTVRGFGLGYAPRYSDSLYQHLKTKGYGDEILMKSGLVYRDDKGKVFDRFWNRVIFPIMDTNKKVIAFGGRVLGEGVPKYLNSPETLIFDKGRNLYGLHRARTSREPFFILCEGYMDVIALHQAGYTSSVASLGTALTKGHAGMIKRYAKEVYITFDSDEAGVQATLRAIPIFSDIDLMPRVVDLRPFKDPDEFIKTRGSDAFRERLESAANGFLFELERMERNYDMVSPEGRTKFFKAVAARLAQFEEEVERTIYIDAVADKYGMHNQQLKSLVTKVAIEAGYGKPAYRPKQVRRSSQDRTEGYLVAQKHLMTYMASDKNLFHQIKKYISPEDFSEGLFKKAAELLFRQYENNHVQPAEIISHFDDEKEHREVASFFHTELKDIPSGVEREKALREMILTVKRRSVAEAMSHISDDDIAGMQKMIEAKKQLQRAEELHISLV